MSALSGSNGAPAPRTPIRYGVIGTGMMGIEHIENINALDGALVTAVCDPVAESLEAAVTAAAPLPDGSELATFETHQELLASGTCDAVVVVTPNHTHLDIVSDVFDSGLHVLIEKPMTIDVAQSRALIERAEATEHINPDRVVWVGLEYRYMPAVARMIDELKTGEIGRPRMVAIREHRFPFLVKVGDWNRFTENTGGTLVEKCCHFFDLMNLLVGERPVRVMASGSQDVNHLDESYEGRVPDILDNAYVIVDYPSGARALLDLCMFADATHNQEEISVVGAKGKLEALLPESVMRKGMRGDHWIGDVQTIPVSDDSIAHEGLHHGSSYVEHERFCAAIRGEQDVEVTLDDGLWSVAVGMAAHMSIDQGRIIDIEHDVFAKGRDAVAEEGDAFAKGRVS